MNSDIIIHLNWAINTIRDKVMFGRDELGAALAREMRAKGVMIDAVKYIEELHEEQQAAQRGFASTASKLANVASPQHLSNEDSPQSVTSDSLRYPKRVAQQEHEEFLLANKGSICCENYGVKPCDCKI
jgi:hypothetical protein